MSIQDDNHHDRNSAPESLGQVLNSLQNILEHKQFLFTNEQDKTHSVIEPITESLSELPDEHEDEREDESLSFDADIALLQAEDISCDDIDIPVLDDIVFKGLSEHPEQNGEIESQLKQLRSELDNIVVDIMDDARQKFESGQDVSATENNMQRFLRELSQKTPD